MRIYMRTTQNNIHKHLPLHFQIETLLGLFPISCLMSFIDFLLIYSTLLSQRRNKFDPPSKILFESTKFYRKYLLTLVLTKKYLEFFGSILNRECLFQRFHVARWRRRGQSAERLKIKRSSTSFTAATTRMAKRGYNP